MSSASYVFIETRSVQERILIPGSSLDVVYNSDSAAKSRLGIQLTPAKIPRGLRKIYTTIRVAGTVTRQIFEAEPNLEYVFGWDRNNVYNQKVYGVVTARVSIGYAYDSCEKPIWTTLTAKLRGFHSETSHVAAGWNIDIHHHYDSFQGMYAYARNMRF